VFAKFKVNISKKTIFQLIQTMDRFLHFIGFCSLFSKYFIVLPLGFNTRIKRYRFIEIDELSSRDIDAKAIDKGYQIQPHLNCITNVKRYNIIRSEMDNIC